MEARISLVTLGVADLPRAVRFYEEVVGWKAASKNEDIAFFDLNGVVFSLFPHEEFMKDMEAGEADIPAYRGCALAHNVRSKEEVDRVFAELRDRGAEIVKEPENVFWGGYSGYFADPDGNRWEVAHNPYWTIRGDGTISMSKD